MLNPNAFKPHMGLSGISGTSVRDSEPDDITWNLNANSEAHKNSPHKIDLSQVIKAQNLFSKTDVIHETELALADELSAIYGANIYLKKENIQRGRTFKIRGAYFQYLMADENERQNGFCVVSDGNMAASVAIIAGMFKIKCALFLSTTCPPYNIQGMRKDGGEFVQIIQSRDTFEECIEAAQAYATEHNMTYLKSFETMTLLQGFATIAKEIIDTKKIKNDIDYVLVPTGGGGLVASIASVFKQLSPKVKVIGVEPQSCKPYSNSIFKGSMVSAEKACRFLVGSSVKETSKTAFDMGRTSVDGFVQVNERQVARKVIKLYSQGFICEPSGALSVTALDKIRNLIKGKTVVCILSGANIDLTKLDEAREMAMVAKGVKNHFQFRLPNKKNVIHDMITTCFKQTDIISIHYSRRLGKQDSQAVISVQSRSDVDVEEYLEKLVQNKYQFENINDREDMLDIFF